MNKPFPSEEIQNAFFDRIERLDEKEIIEINNNDFSGDINNVVVGLNTHCFGIWLLKDDPEENYQLFYINGAGILQGDYLQLCWSLPHRDYVVFAFCIYLSNSYDNLDPINLFNIFQQKTQSLLEKNGYITVTNKDVEKYDNPTFVSIGTKGIRKINFMDRLEIYQEIFGKPDLSSIIQGEQYIYLMLNKRNNYIKIGKSIKPGFREKTLQSEEPDIVLVAFWKAPAKVERELHNIFKTSRKRGEWFDIKFKHIKQINEYMKGYN